MYTHSIYSICYVIVVLYVICYSSVYIAYVMYMYSI